MLLKKLLRKIEESLGEKEQVTFQTENDNTAPSVNYVHTGHNAALSISEENNVLVLDWIEKKKNGYDKASNKYPKWFSTRYGIDFNYTMNEYIEQGVLAEQDGIVSLTSLGLEKIKEYDYVIYIHNHPQYCLTLSDFQNAEILHRVKNSDIAWGIFNHRIIEYTQKCMWESLAANYANMADLLISEDKCEQALDFIFATSYIETSGMMDNNELKPIMTEYTKSGIKRKKLKNGMPDIYLLEINNYYVTVPFKKIQGKTSLGWDDVKNRYTNSAQITALEGILPFRYFEKNESFEIFKQAIEAGGEKGIFRLIDCTKKLKSNTPDEQSSKYFYASPENMAYRKLNHGE